VTPAAPARPPLAAAALAALLAACAPPGGDLQQGTLEIGDQGGTVAAPAGPAAGPR